MRWRALIPSLLTGMALLVAAPAAAAEKLPDPTGHVVDTADALDDRAQRQLETRLRAYAAKGGHQLAIAIVPTTGGQSIEDYSADLFAEWGVGNKQADDGVLLVLAMNDRKMRIEVGYGAEAVLTDAEAGRIIRDQLTPRLRAGDLPGALTAAVDRILSELDQLDTEAPQAIHQLAPAASDPDRSRLPVGLMVFGGLAGLVGAVALLALGGGRAPVTFDAVPAERTRPRAAAGVSRRRTTKRRATRRVPAARDSDDDLAALAVTAAVLHSHRDDRSEHSDDSSSSDDDSSYSGLSSLGGLGGFGGSDGGGFGGFGGGDSGGGGASGGW